MNDYRTVDQELIAFMASLLQDPNIARRAWPASDTSIETEEARKATEKVNNMTREAFNPDTDHEEWSKWNEAINDLWYTHTIQGFLQGCKFAADILLPLAAPDALGVYRDHSNDSEEE